MAMRHLTAKQLQEHLATSDTSPLLLDVREPWEYQICALENSTLIPMRQIPAAVEQGELDPQQETVVICHHGIRSKQVGRYLENCGFDNIINLTGGVEAWAREVDVHMATY